MGLRRLVTALAIPCACIAAERAIGQDRSVYGPQEPATRSVIHQSPADARTYGLPVIAEPGRPRSDMLGSWAVGARAEFGIGRFRVGEIARQRTHMEPVRDDLMARENRAIGGAGLRLRFPR